MDAPRNLLCLHERCESREPAGRMPGCHGLAGAPDAGASASLLVAGRGALAPALGRRHDGLERACRRRDVLLGRRRPSRHRHEGRADGARARWATPLGRSGSCASSNGTGAEAWNSDPGMTRASCRTDRPWYSRPSTSTAQTCGSTRSRTARGDACSGAHPVPVATHRPFHPTAVRWPSPVTDGCSSWVWTARACANGVRRKVPTAESPLSMPPGLRCCSCATGRASPG